MIKSTAFSVLIFLCTVILSLAEPTVSDSKIFLESDRNDDSKKGVKIIEWYISPQTLEKLPSFDPATSDAPLSLKAAIAIAHDNLGKNVKKIDKWNLDSVEIHQIDSGMIGVTIPTLWTPHPTGKWYYKIIFSRPVDAQDIETKVYSGPHTIYVLMDGTVCEPRTRPQTKDEMAEDKQFGDELKKAVKADTK